MLRLPFTRSVLTLLFCVGLLPVRAGAQDAESLFLEAVESFRRGDSVAAAEKLQAALAGNPGHEQAFLLLSQVDQQILREMLVSRGDLGALAERFLGLARIGRRVVASDPGGAADAVARALDGDELERARAVVELAATYGEWAVPALVGPLGDRSDPERRVRAIQTLLHLGETATIPLVAALSAEDELTRTNAASVLGALRDPRAAAALARMASQDSSNTARAMAAESLARLRPDLQLLGLTGDPVDLALGLAQRWLAGAPELVKPYGTGRVSWHWEGGLVGTTVFGGLYALDLAEATLRGALGSGAREAEVRAALAAVHAAQKAEILAARALPALDDAELLEAALLRLPRLDLELALAGPHRASALTALRGNDTQRLAAGVLMGAMGRSEPELAALRAALAVAPEGLAFDAALALARAGDGSPAVVARLSAALTLTPARLAMSIGDTGLGGEHKGWQHLSASTVADGLLRAKAFPPKDVVLVRDGLQGVTLDTLVFGLRNDPRTAEVPIVVVTQEVDAVQGLYGETVSAVVSAASWDTVAEVAGERAELQQAAAARAQAAAYALASLPASTVSPAASATAEALGSSGDDEVLVAMLHLAGRAGLTNALSAVEALVLEPGSRDVRLAAYSAAADLWALAGGSSGSRDELAAALQDALAEDDPDLALAAARALGQLGAGASASAG